MPRILRRERALDDLIEHWTYRATEVSPESADALLDQIERRLLLLASYPESGTRRDELRPGLRSIVLGKLVLLYHPLRDGIELVRVLHGARDLPTILADNDPDLPDES
jgi:toxin ParE1/3/4